MKVKEGQLLHAGDWESGGVAYVQRTLEELGADLEYYTKQWEGGQSCTSLREVLSGRKESEEGKDKGRRRVGDVVCLGLGSLQSARREGRRSSFTQLAALRTILEILGKYPSPNSGVARLMVVQSRRRETSMRIPRSAIHLPRQRIPYLPRIHSSRRSISIWTYNGEELGVCYTLLWAGL